MYGEGKAKIMLLVFEEPREYHEGRSQVTETDQTKLVSNVICAFSNQSPNHLQHNSLLRAQLCPLKCVLGPSPRAREEPGARVFAQDQSQQGGKNPGDLANSQALISQGRT